MPTTSLRRLLVPLAVCAASGAPALAAEPAWLGAADCRIAPLKPTPTAGVNWTGACADGFASGKGVLAWDSARPGKVTLEATLVRGLPNGEVILKTSEFGFAGTVRNGVPHGEGYIQREGWGWYEGEVVDGLPQGKGTHLAVDRSRYTGEWVQGKRHGRGEASFATGGSYTGGWQNDAFDGQGLIVYAGAGHKYEGAFQDGRVAGLPQPALAQGRYTIAGRAHDDGVVSALPVKASWGELTLAQKNTFRNHYPALEAGDEPPFPVKGQGPLLEEARRINADFGPVKGSLSVHVLVGKDGKALSVTAYGAPTATIVRALSALFMREQYKPALCRGKPCDMVYPLNFSFSVVD